ncbi:hypothetical protein DVH24_031492 [Malus domestica]|uniref:Uncharacterized protein n=1 Tax=Malus domestica TaxID=3750 RepID=A0A498HDM5_MALDO|nr:hypothetical protein DVH24_031492 [Malus domestica]
MVLFTCSFSLKLKPYLLTLRHLLFLVPIRSLRCSAHLRPVFVFFLPSNLRRCNPSHSQSVSPSHSQSLTPMTCDGMTRASSSFESFRHFQS